MEKRKFEERIKELTPYRVTADVMKNAGEGGAWGVALLALYRATKCGTLEDFLDKRDQWHGKWDYDKMVDTYNRIKK